MRQEALRLGATGWVRNLADGRVEAMVCGEPGIVNALLEWARRGPPKARVENVEADEIPEKAFADFEKRA
jgi:acylphosphatase